MSDSSMVPWHDRAPGTVRVGDHESCPPFMPGYLVHSLTSRGVALPIAYRAALGIEAGLAGRQRISSAELRGLIREELDFDPFTDRDPDRDIEVPGSRHGVPFSKGVLAQSLLASAIEPIAAFRIAQRLERELQAFGTREIHRSELRGMAARALERLSSFEAAQRYQCWSRHAASDRPVIVLLGGTSGVGKTTIALELARRLGIRRVLSTDSIRQVMRIMISQDLVPAIHGSSYNTHELLPRIKGEKRSVIGGFRAQASAISVGIRACLDRAIAESTHLVIEGVSLVPGMIDLDPYRDDAHVVPFLISTIEPSSLRSRFETRGEEERRRPRHRYLDHFEAILEIQQHLVRRAKRHRAPVFDNTDLENTVGAVIRHVVDGLPSVKSRRKSSR